MLKITEVYPKQLRNPKVRSSDQLRWEEELTIKLSGQANDRLKLRAASVKNTIFISTKFESTLSCLK